MKNGPALGREALRVSFNGISQAQECENERGDTSATDESRPQVLHRRVENTGGNLHSSISVPQLPRETTKISLYSLTDHREVELDVSRRRVPVVDAAAVDVLVLKEGQRTDEGAVYK